MPLRPLLLLALAALAVIGVSTPAVACCTCAVPCASVVTAPPAPAYVKHVYVRRHHIKHAYVRRYRKPIYIVEEGPVYDGPSIVTRPRIVPFNKPLARYPVIRETFYYPTYRDRYTVPPWYRPW